MPDSSGRVNKHCRREHDYDIEKCLHICYRSSEHHYTSDYEALTIGDQDGFEWGVYSNGEVPSNALVVDDLAEDNTLYIGRTVTGSDIISTAKAWQKVSSNLPHERKAWKKCLLIYHMKE